MPEPTAAGFGIQTAARRTGLSPHTLRAWEQRYGAIRIARSPAGRRRYTTTDLDRLRLLKLLVDSGDRIGKLAALSDGQLRNRAAELGMVARQVGGRSLRIAAWGDSLPIRLASLAADIQLVATSSSFEDFVAQCQRSGPQLVIVEIDSLTARKLALLGRLRSSLPGVPLGIIYGFARRRDVEQLRAVCDSLSRAPADLRSMVDLLAGQRSPDETMPEPKRADGSTPDAGRDVPARLFTGRQLGFLATQGTNIDCECPAHLVQLIQTLIGFERYSAGCAQDDPAEAALHRMLLATTAQSRRSLEAALAKVAAHEGIRIPD